jgi:glycerol uptake facilitator-like aquaporin
VSADTARALAGEFVGSALLAAVVVGSGIAAQTLSPSDTGLALFENAFATALGLGVLILIFQTVSGAHFNPVVSLVDALLHRKGWAITSAYVPTQIVGCVSGAVLANLMFAVPVEWSTTERATWPHLLAEVVATTGLVLVIFALVRTGRSHLAAPAVGAFIGAAYFFTSSTSFANPAITIGRAFSDTFAGIAPTSVLPFIGAQLVGGAIGWMLVRGFFPVSAPVPDAERSTAAPAASGG